MYSIPTNKSPLSVIFVVTPSSIKVLEGDEGNPWFAATISLNDDADCKFTVDGKEYDSWQIRKKALEGLMFDQFLLSKP